MDASSSVIRSARAANKLWRSEQADSARAVKKASLLAKLIVAHARMQEQIYALLNPQQQRKLDNLEASTVVASK